MIPEEPTKTREVFSFQIRDETEAVTGRHFIFCENTVAILLVTVSSSHSRSYVLGRCMWLLRLVRRRQYTHHREWLRQGRNETGSIWYIKFYIFALYCKKESE